VAGSMRRKAAFTALMAALRSSRGGPSIMARLGAVPRMVVATLRGEYDGGRQLAMMAAAVAYIVSPIDLVPEAFLFVIGLADDAFVATWLAGSVLAETERFLAWERERGPVGRRVKPHSAHH
jgi:uncharacterized membrane protein YkvA (DUF1232 family)